MDWGKIKSILLILLLITNILLGFVIFQDRMLFNRGQENQLEDILTYLKNSDISVKVDSLDFPKELESVYLRFDTFEVKEPQDFFSGDFTRESDQDFLDSNYRLFLEDQHLIWGLKNHFLRMQREFDIQFARAEKLEWSSDLSSLKEDALQILLEKGHSITYDIYDFYNVGPYQALLMQQTYKDTIIEESRSVFWFFNGEWVGFKQFWPAEIIATDGQNYDILSIDLALYRGINEFRKGDSILDISLVYKLNDQSLSLNQLVSGEALPYYRFQMESGMVYYVQAVD